MPECDESARGTHSVTNVINNGVYRLSDGIY